MKFLPYEDVPLYIAVSGQAGEYIFAESASISVDQQIEPVKLEYANSASVGLATTHMLPPLS